MVSRDAWNGLDTGQGGDDKVKDQVLLMTTLDPGSELRRLVLRYFHDEGGFISYKEWYRFDTETGGRLDPLLQSEWIPEGFIQNNPEQGGYTLTATGKNELNRLTVAKFRNPQNRNDEPA